MNFYFIRWIYLVLVSVVKLCSGSLPIAYPKSSPIVLYMYVI